MVDLPSPRTSAQNHPLWVWVRFAREFLVGALVLLILLIAYGLLPNRWYHSLYVYSGSMAPAIQPGDIIFITPPEKAVKSGMIVTLSVDGLLVTHRVIDVGPNGEFVTKGDANTLQDEWGSSKVKLVGVYRARIPYIGYAFAAMQNLFKVNASGAWFNDREMVKLQARLGKQTVATPEQEPETRVTPTPDSTPIPTSLPTQPPTPTPLPSSTPVDDSATATPGPTPPAAVTETATSPASEDIVANPIPTETISP